MSIKRYWRLFVPLPFLAIAISVIWWRGPDWNAVQDAFTAVYWPWIVAAVGFNLLSVIVRALAWNTAIGQAMPPPHPRFRLVFAAFSVGLFANVVLPGRVGELARVAVLTRRMPGRQGVWATLIGSVFAHRAFDLFPATALVVWVLFAAKLPAWAFGSMIAVVGAGFALFTFAWITARRQQTRLDGLGTVRTLIVRVRAGLAVMRAPAAALAAGTFQFLGWVCQLAAVWAAMRAFNIHLPLAAAGVVLVLMNVATIFPLWPGNVGLVQAAVALPLVSYGVFYPHGFAFGIGLQAIEASVGVGIGLVFLAREGFSYAMLKEMPDASADDAGIAERPERPEAPAARILASPASLKGVLSATEAAAALVVGLGEGAVALPVADGGEGTAEVLATVLGGEWKEAAAADPLGRPVTARWLLLPDGTAVVESAEAIGLARLGDDELDPLVASSAGLGELLLEVLAERPSSVLVCLGGSATVDGGAGLISVLPEWPQSVPLRVACDVRNPLLGERGAARVFGPQKGASPEAVEELEQRLAATAELEPYGDLPGAGAAGGLGAALALLGGELVEGAELVLDLIGFDERARGAALVVTGEGTVDATTFEGKAPGAVAARCKRVGVRCVLFGGRVEEGIEAEVLSGDPAHAREDLAALGVRLSAR